MLQSLRLFPQLLAVPAYNELLKLSPDLLQVELSVNQVQMEMKSDLHRVVRHQEDILDGEGEDV